MRSAKVTTKQILRVLKQLQQFGSVHNLTTFEQHVISYYDKLPLDQKVKLVEQLKPDDDIVNRRKKRRENRSPTPITTAENPQNWSQGSRSPVNFSNQEQVSAIHTMPDESPDVSSTLQRAESPVDPHIQSHFSNDSNWDPNQNVLGNTSASFAIGNPTVSTPIGNLPKQMEIGALENIGNSCYMNAVLYALRFTPLFLHNFHHLVMNLHSFTEDINFSPTNISCGKCIATTKLTLNSDRWPDDVPIDERIKRILCELHEVLMGLTNADNSSGSAIRAHKLQRAVYAMNDTFEPGTQQDSHEFLMFVLNCLRDVSDVIINMIENHPETFAGIIDPALNLSFDYFRSNFMGQRLSSTRCRYCETELKHYDEMIDVFLTLPPNGIFHEDFIKSSCVTRERFEDSDKIKCTECCRYTESVQTTTFPRLPRILIMQLGRFDNQMNKLNMAVPIQYRLECFCSTCASMPEGTKNQDHEYRLYGMIVHRGVHPTSGHYMAYVRLLEDEMNLQHDCEGDSCCKIKLKRTKTGQIYEDMSRRWFICNDDTITKMQRSDFYKMIESEASRNTPYILFYVRNDLNASE